MKSLHIVEEEVFGQAITGLGDRLVLVEIERNKKISKKRYIVEQYFGLSHLHDGAYRARFTTIVKNLWDTMCRQMPFNLFRGSKLLVTA